MRSGYDGLFEASLFGCQVILSIKRGLFWAMLWSLSNFFRDRQRWDITAGNEGCASYLAAHVTPMEVPCTTTSAPAVWCRTQTHRIVRSSSEWQEQTRRIFQVTDGSRDAFGCLSVAQRTLRRNILLKLCWTGQRQTYPFLSLEANEAAWCCECLVIHQFFLLPDSFDS